MLLIPTLLALLATTPGTTAVAPAPRLSADVVPLRYAISLDVSDYVTADRFSGQETVDVTLAKPTDTIVLHAHDLTIDQASANAKLTATVTLDAAAQTATLHFPSPLPAGAASLTLGYHAPYGPLRGLYKAKHGDRVYLGTQLESADARRVFPAFDEPAFKASFALTVRAPGDLAVISNTVGVVDKAGAAQVVHFAPTKPISSYLVALAVGPYEATRRQVAAQRGPLAVAVWTPRGESALTGLALDTAAQVIPWYERYFAQPFPFDKLDMVAIPDFEFGGMENAGAIFYEETALLLDPHQATPARTYRVGSVVAHEIAHQWFGDLVTMKWWDDLWLNESFATWMETKALTALHPEWAADEDFAESRSGAFAADELGATHAVHQPIADVADVEGAIDAITYEKGASVLFMLDQLVGVEAMQRGVQSYMAAHRYANATAEDLWRALETVSKKPIRQVAQSWIDQPGYPLVDATLRCQEAQEVLELTQTRSQLEGPASTARWQIPLCARSGATEICTLFSDEHASLQLGSCAPQRAWVANAHRTGFFRVRYDAATLALLRKQLSTLDAFERFALINDYASLGGSGRAPYEQLLALLDAEVDESNALALDAVEAVIVSLDNVLVADGDRPRFHRAVQRLLGPLVERLGWQARPTDSNQDRRVRVDALTTLGTYGQPPALVAEARDKVTQLLAQPSSSTMDPTEAEAALEIAAPSGDAALWEKLHTALTTTGDPDTHARLLDALARFEAPALIDRNLKLTVTPHALQLKDTARFLGQLLRQRASRARTWAFLQAEWPAVKPHVPVTFPLRLRGGLGMLCSDAAPAQIRRFYARPDVHAAGLERAEALALESNARCLVVKRSAPAVHAWLLHSAKTPARNP